jgi:hypothetical protein
VQELKYKISAYLSEEELEKFNYRVMARGVTTSAYIREMLSFDIRERGAPKGPRRKKEQQAKPVKSKRAAKEKGSRKSAAKLRMSQLPFQD